MFLFLRLFILLYFSFISQILSSVVDFFKQNQNQDLLFGLDAEKSKFYIFDWPKEVQFSIPPENSVLSQTTTEQESFSHNHAEHFGNGKILNEKFSFYQSSIYQFYHICLSKLRVHPRRTFNYSEAEFYVMPYDIGFSAAFNKQTGLFHSKVYSNGCPEHSSIIPLLKQEIQKTKLQGHNIVIFNSLADNFPYHCRNIINVCLNCTILNFDIEDYLENKLYKNADNGQFGLNRRVFSVPFPSLHRWNENYSPYVSFTNLRIPLSKSTLSHFSVNILKNYSRPIFVSFWGSTFVWYKPATIVRNHLVENCKSHPRYCYYLPSINRLQNSAVQNLSAIEVYSNSVFCFQPSGDLESRKGIFDSFSVGCIPVICTNGLLNKTYPWYFTKEDERKTSVYIPHSIITKGVDVIKDILLKIPIEVIQQKRESIELISKSLQYAVPPDRMKGYIGYGGSTGEFDGKKRWRPPFYDAIDGIIDNMSKISRRYKESGTISEDEAPNKVSRWDYLWIDNPVPRNSHPIIIH